LTNRINHVQYALNENQSKSLLLSLAGFVTTA
jgi:hypothetical protein